jgi:hypothetical protein
MRFALLLCYLTAVLCGPRPCCCATPPEKPTAPAKKPACPLCASEQKPEPKPHTPAKKHNCPCPKAEVKAPTTPHNPDNTRQLWPADGAVVVTSSAVHSHTVRVVYPGPPPDPSPHLPLLCHRLRC